MRKIMILAIACAMVVALAAASASAYSSYANSTGKPCTYCHLDGSSGGSLTPEGRYYRDNGTLPPATPATPAAPTGLSATAASTSQINLKWTDASSNETGFKVERASASSGPFSVIATLGAGVTTYNNTGLNASTTYYYRVCSYSSAGNSGYSNTTSATTLAPTPAPTAPAAPTGLSATAASTSQINLKWTDASSNETGFKVERASASAGPFAVIATLGAGVTTYNNAGLSASTTYYYRVCATNAVGDSGYSNTTSATTSGSTSTLPTAPANLIAAVSSSQIVLKWSDASSNETGFKVERSLNSDGPFEVIATVGAGVTTCTNGGLTGATTYYYRVCAYNTAGNSGYSNTASATTPARPTRIPKAPSRLDARGISSSEIRLRWSDNSYNETGFKVERASSSDGPFEVIATLKAGTRTYKDTSLEASTRYYYRVCAFNAGGDSEYSRIDSAATRRSGGYGDDDDDDDDRDDNDDDDDDRRDRDDNERDDD